MADPDLTVDRSVRENDSFVFINYSGKRDEKKENRQLINRASQKNYHRRKRLHSMLLSNSPMSISMSSTGSEKRASMRTPIDIQSKEMMTDFSPERILPAPFYQRGMTIEDEEVISYCSDPVLPTSKSRLPGPYTHDRMWRPSTDLLHPSTIIRKGSSDPFNSLAISFDPMVNKLMAFNRNCLMPSMYGFEINIACTATYYMQGFQAAASALSDEGIAYATLSRSAAVMASATNDRTLYFKAITYKTKAYSLLRTRITKQKEQPDEAFYSLIYALQAAELVAHNFTDAAVHGKMLSRIWQRNGPTHTDPRLLHKALYNDIQRASISLSRPCFDLDRWDPNQLHSDWRDFVEPEALLYYRHEPKLLDPALKDPMLRTIFGDLKEILQIYELLIEHLEFAASDLFLWLSTRSLLCEGRLLNHYLDLVEHPQEDHEQQTQTPTMLSASTYASASACLAGVYWIRRTACYESLGIDSPLSKTGSKVFNAGPLILKKLGELLALWNDHEGEVQLSSSAHSRLRLWIIYVGVVVEQDVYQGLPVPKAPRMYAGVLVRLVSDMRLFYWQDVREVLEGFLYNDLITPNGALWFSKITRAHDKAIWKFR